MDQTLLMFSKSMGSGPNTKKRGVANRSVMFLSLQGRAVQTAQSLDEGLALAIPLDDIYQPYDENHGKLVHLSGPLKTEQVRKCRENCVILTCTINMYHKNFFTIFKKNYILILVIFWLIQYRLFKSTTKLHTIIQVHVNLHKIIHVICPNICTHKN